MRISDSLDNSHNRDDNCSDIVNLWKQSVEQKNEENAAINRTKIGERLSGSRSVVWTSLSQMSPSDQAVMMNKLTSFWPYEYERRALNWPMHIGLITNCITSSMIATKINSDMVMFNPKMSFLESVKKCPKSPLIFGIYSSGLTYYVTQQVTIMPNLYRESHPCSSCILSQSIAIALFTGVVMPMLSTPYLCYYVLLQRKEEKFPAIKNILEFLTLSWEGSRAARSCLVKVIPLQIVVTSLCTYAILWGRKRIFGTMDADPEMVRDLLVTVQTKPGLKQRVTEFLQKLPVVSGLLGGEAPENERIT